MPEDDVERAVAQLSSLHDGDLALLEIVALGPRAIPSLRSLLYESEPSGLFPARCRAVAALAALGAYDVLIDFLSTRQWITDPVQRLGEDAVMNAAALALGNIHTEEVFQLLVSLVQVRILPGLIKSLGTFHRPETLPYLIAALKEDESRPLAEDALRRLEGVAGPALLAAAEECQHGSVQSESELRQYRSIRALLAELNVTDKES